MATQNCRLVKADLARHLAKRVVVSSDKAQCAVSLPIQTLDGRYVEVFIQDKIGDFVLVHDGGQATAELFVQGIHLTETKRNTLSAIARRMGATFSDDVFEIACRREQSATAIMAIAQCASLAMFEVLSHVPAIEDEP